jgi:prophage maintenance system killer protein
MEALTHEDALSLLAEIGAREREHALKAILGNIEQTFGGVSLYPTVESRAAHLLYFVVKDHALLDGTKRGTSVLFDEYLRKNGRPTLSPQLFGRLVTEIEAGSGRVHQERMVATIEAALAVTGGDYSL